MIGKLFSDLELLQIFCYNYSSSYRRKYNRNKKAAPVPVKNLIIKLILIILAFLDKLKIAKSVNMSLLIKFSCFISFSPP